MSASSSSPRNVACDRTNQMDSEDHSGLYLDEDMSNPDDVGLGEREDWPLPSSRTSAKEQRPQEEDRRQQRQAHHDKRIRRSDHTMGRPMDTTPAYSREPDVSDIEEGSGEDESYNLQPNRYNAGQPSPAVRPSGRVRDRVVVMPDPDERSVSPIREEHFQDHRSVGVQSTRDLDINAQTGRLPDEAGDEIMENGIERDFYQPQRHPELLTNSKTERQSPTSAAPSVEDLYIDSPISDEHPPLNVHPANAMHQTSHRTSRHSDGPSQLPLNRRRMRHGPQAQQAEDSPRPRIHIVKLFSNTVTASAGFPQGEAFGFSISPGGCRIAVFNSARLYVLQTAALPLCNSQDYALKRRPLAVDLTDDGHHLAILADDHTVNVYRLGHQRLRRVRTVALESPACCITLAPTGGLLAVAFEGGVEIFSLDTNALPTDRRAVRAVKMDRLTFSDDGSTLLGTTTRINATSSIIVSVPVFPASADGIATHEELKEAWCTGLLHPENIRNSSHAMFMREDRKTNNEHLFSWNGLADTFGILNVSNMQYSNADFPVVIDPPLSTCGGLGAAIHSCPTVDESGSTVAMIVNDRTIRLYSVPPIDEDDGAPVKAHSVDHELDEGYGCPFSELRWVSLLPDTFDHSRSGPRLVVASPGGVIESSAHDETVEDIEGGRIIVIDFGSQFADQPGETFSVTLGTSSSQTLEEEQVDVAEAVALVRRRTISQNKSNSLSARPSTLGRSATTVGTPWLARPNGMSLRADPQRRASMMSLGSVNSEASRSLPDILDNREHATALEEPYAQNAPRSQASLQRAATNAQRHRYQALEERTREVTSGNSDVNLLPLPEYTEEPNAPLPNRFRAMAGLDRPATYIPSRPALSTNLSTNDWSTSPSGSLTAPADVGEHFSSSDAFEAVQAQANGGSFAGEGSLSATMRSPANRRVDIVSGSAARSSTDPLPTRSDSLAAQNLTGSDRNTDTLQATPRNFQRPYNNGGVSNGSRTQFSSEPSGSTVENQYITTQTGPAGQPSSAGIPTNDTNPEELFNRTNLENGHARSPFGRVFQNSLAKRHSTSILSSPSERSTPVRNSASMSAYAATVASGMRSSSQGSRTGPTAQRPWQQHREGPASASLFPATQPSNFVPLRAPMPNAGAVAHPVIGWHPPASNATGQQQPPMRSGSGRVSQSRRSSAIGSAGKSAFASTAQAKRRSLFKRSNTVARRAATPDFPRSRAANAEGGGTGASSMFETKNLTTWTARGDGGKCILM